MEREHLRPDTIKANEIVAQPGWPFEQGPQPNLELDAVNGVAEQNMLASVIWPQHDRRMIQAPDVESVFVTMR